MLSIIYLTFSFPYLSSINSSSSLNLVKTIRLVKFELLTFELIFLGSAL